MKTIKYFLLVATALLLTTTGCSNKDSEFYNDVFVKSPDLVAFNYDNVAKSINVTADIPRLLNEQGQPNQLDIYRSTGGATRLDFSYVIEKQVDANNWANYEVADSQIALVRGEGYSAGPYIVASSLYNASNQTYEFKAGIHSLPAGSYRLSFGYNSTSTTDVEFRSESENNQLFLNLNSASSLLDGGGFYTFTVN